MSDYGERIELVLLRQEVRQLVELNLSNREEISLLKQIRDRLSTPARLSFIKLIFGGRMPGPVTLNPGQSVIATVEGFDQFGNPFPIDFTANPVTFTLDNPTLDTEVTGTAPGTEDITYEAAGTANLTATCAGFSDTEQIINSSPAPKLASIKVSFGTPTP